MYPFFDLHCDTFYALYKDPRKGNLLSNTLHADITRMEAVGDVTSCFAIFVDTDESSSSWNKACALHDLFFSSLETHSPRIQQVRTSSDILRTATPSALLTCEEGQILEGDLSCLAILSRTLVVKRFRRWRGWVSLLLCPLSVMVAFAPFSLPAEKRTLLLECSP